MRLLGGKYFRWRRCLKDIGMCGRFVQRYTWDDIQDLYDLQDGAAPNLQAHYNVAPTDSVSVVRSSTGGTTELISMRWGLVPWWWKKPLKQLPASFNARAESVADKPMFRDAFKRHRCIIPASGYYEWLKRPDGRQPYFISAADGGVLSFAGLWDRWKNPETGEPVISCTIIVTDANVLTRPIHDRMPVVLDKADIRPWLSGEAGVKLLKPTAEDRLRMWPISRRVNHSCRPAGRTHVGRRSRRSPSPTLRHSPRAGRSAARGASAPTEAICAARRNVPCALPD
jgi:putative SOS response-associated peptidase YedK